MLAFQELPSAGRLVTVERARHARFFSVSAWSAMLLLGAVASSLLIWSYAHALGVGQDVEHARALALTVLVLMSAAMTSALTQLRSAPARWAALATAASAVILVQWPVVSARWSDDDPAALAHEVPQCR
jgi:chromate transport protein ChrA